MQLRNVDLRSVGHSSQKLWPTTFFARKMPCILHCNAKKIRSMFSRIVRDLVQKAKWSEIFLSQVTYSTHGYHLGHYHFLMGSGAEAGIARVVKCRRHSDNPSLVIMEISVIREISVISGGFRYQIDFS